MKPSSYIAVIVLIVVLINFLLMVFQRLNVWIFWFVVVFSAVIAFWVVPKLRKRGI